MSTRATLPSPAFATHRNLPEIVSAVGRSLRAQSGRLIQTGFVRSYALVVFLGPVALLAYVGVRS